MMEVMPVASQPIYQFYAELKDYKPLIWRRFQVAGNITLAQLGYVTMTLFEMKGSHLFHLEYSVNENMPDDDPAYQSEPDKILRYDIAGGDSFPETMISNTYAATEISSFNVRCSVLINRIPPSFLFSIFASLSFYQLRSISAGTCSDFYCLFQTFQIEILRLKHQLFGA